MEIEEIKKYEGKNLIITLITSFTYKGKIKKINEESFLFLDIYSNEILLSPKMVGMIMEDKKK